MMDYEAEITLLNINEVWLKVPETSRRTYIPVVGDGRQTSYADYSFDLAFSNSVIEHVGSEEDAARLLLRCSEWGERSTVRRRTSGFLLNLISARCFCTGSRPC